MATDKFDKFSNRGIIFLCYLNIHCGADISESNLITTLILRKRSFDK